jgi:transaldolase
MDQNPLKKLESFGQSIWMDFIRRGVLTSGQFQRWIDEDGVSGVTSNPSIFQKAMSEGDAYDADIEKLSAEGKSTEEIFDALAVEDIREACDVLGPVYTVLGCADLSSGRPSHHARSACRGAGPAPRVLRQDRHLK